MKFMPFAAALCLAAVPAFAAPLIPDQPMALGNAEVVCTGVGSAEDNPQWSAYPIRMVFSNSGGQFVSGVNISLQNAKGGQIGQWDCDTPWALLKLPSGDYKASVRLNETGVVRTASFSSSGRYTSASYTGGPKGQMRVEIQFPLPPNQ